MLSVILFIAFFSIYSALIYSPEAPVVLVSESFTETEVIQTELFPQVFEPKVEPAEVIEEVVQENIQPTTEVIEPLENYGIRELRVMARGKVSGFMKMKKNQLIEELNKLD